jgi:4-alpha-glucanotransferase
LRQKPLTKKQRLQKNPWGIDLNYEDAFGKRHEPPPETVAAILECMGVDASGAEPPPHESVLVVRPEERRRLPSPAELVLESGDRYRVEGRLPPDLPFGYHELHPLECKQSIRLIASPGRCYLPENLETCGWAVQLYAARSRSSWGMGDLADLRRLARWSAEELGHGMLLMNPICATLPFVPQQDSPYYPSSRRYLNPLYLRIEEIPGARDAGVALDDLIRAGRALNHDRHIDRNRIFGLKMQALDRIWSGFNGDSDFDEYCRERGRDLDAFAAFCVLAEHYRNGWRDWPSEHRRPDASGVQPFAREHEDRVRFHKWVQWLIDRQLASASRHIAITQDLPIGVDPAGADAWAWQDVLANNVSVGAPPDEFNTSGQDWDLPPFIPQKLKAARYDPFIQTIRATLRHAGGLRIDHVMGLFRLFWIPKGMSAAQGAYVRYPADDLLAILALESYRTKAFIVGEDLGTVEEGVREQMRRHAMLSYRLLWFEKDPPETYPRDALAAVTTHDLPTVAGLWSGSDLEYQRKLNLSPNVDSTNEMRGRLRDMAGLRESAPSEEAVRSAYRLLARSPSRILTAALEDGLAVQERPNMPATTSEQSPNWSLALPKTLEEIEQDSAVRDVGRTVCRVIREPRETPPSGSAGKPRAPNRAIPDLRV